jgi:hypothetical protein
MLNTVRKTLEMPHHGEGHFFPIMHALHRATNMYFERHKFQAKSERHMLHHVDIAEFRNLLVEPVRTVYHNLYGGDGFVDKTPGKDGIVAIPHMQKVFPTMRVIYAQRRGLEVIRSAVLKFPQADFRTHCEIWRDCVMSWKESRERLRCAFYEVDQFDLHHYPELVTARLSTFLELSEEQSEKMLGFFRSDRPQSSGALNEVPRSIDELDWSAEQIDIFREVCGEAMEACGYSETASYYSDAKLAERSNT